MKEVKRVILPGSYDPITLGHLEIIKKAAEEYSEVLAVGFINPKKSYLFDDAERLEMLEIATRGLANVKVDLSRGLVVDYMKTADIQLIIKGYRNEKDYEYELLQAEWNEEHGGFKTRLIKCAAEFEDVSSTAARGAILSGDRQKAEQILPKDVADFIFTKSKVFKNR